MSAIATEKAELLSGGATARIEVVAAPPSMSGRTLWMVSLLNRRRFQ
jgi:hypothetical protein